MTVSVTVFPNSRIRHIKVEGDTPSQTPFIVQGSIGQTAPVQEWRNDTGLAIAKIGSDGSFQIVYPGDEGNASKLVTRAGFAPNSLAIIGAGTTTGSRSVIVYDNLDVVAALTVQGSAVISGGVVTLNSVLTQGTQGIDWYPAVPLNYAIHRTSEAWSAPDYAQLRLGWITGIILDPGTAYGKSWLEVRGQTRMYNQVAAAAALIVRGAASQTGDLQQWQNDTGTRLLSVQSDGALIFGAGATTSYLFSPTASEGSRLQATAAGRVPLVVKGFASQTANLQQWQNDSGTVLARVRNDGLIAAPYFRDTTDGGPYLAMQTTAMVATSGIASHNIFAVRAVASQTGDLQRWENSGAAIQSRVDKNGHFMTRKTAVPADADIATSEAALSWDDRAASPQLLIKGKDSAGTVRTYAPSRLLGISRYTTSGPSAAHTSITTIGMSLTFTMPTLQTGQRVKVEAFCYYFNAASNIAAANSLYTFIYAGGTRIVSQFEYVPVTSTVLHFPDLWGYIDNSQVAAGTSVTVDVYTLSSSNIAYQFVAGPEDPATLTATIV